MSELNNQIIAKLLEIKSVSINPVHPFTYASGIKSPIYTDLRLTISYPQLRNMIAEGLAKKIKKEFPEVTVIGGVATAGIPHAAWIADLLDLPLVYVRSKPKDHGAGKQIEGQVTSADKVVLIDDLISTGGSVLNTVAPVESTGATVIGIAAIFSYDLPETTQNFKKQDVKLQPLIKYQQLLRYIEQEQILEPSEIKLAEKWHQDPWNWQAK